MVSWNLVDLEERLAFHVQLEITGKLFGFDSTEVDLVVDTFYGVYQPEPEDYLVDPEEIQALTQRGLLLGQKIQLPKPLKDYLKSMPLNR